MLLIHISQLHSDFHSADARLSEEEEMEYEYGEEEDEEEEEDGKEVECEQEDEEELPAVPSKASHCRLTCCISRMHTVHAHVNPVQIESSDVSSSSGCLYSAFLSCGC
jgi:hypothetical protein